MTGAPERAVDEHAVRRRGRRRRGRPGCCARAAGAWRAPCAPITPQRARRRASATPSAGEDRHERGAAGRGEQQRDAGRRAPRRRRRRALRGSARGPPPPPERRRRARAKGRARTRISPAIRGYSRSARAEMSSCTAAMPLPKEVTFVTFDVYGTLIDWETGAYDAFAKEAEKDGYTLVQGGARPALPRDPAGDQGRLVRALRRGPAPHRRPDLAPARLAARAVALRVPPELGRPLAAVQGDQHPARPLRARSSSSV